MERLLARGVDGGVRQTLRAIGLAVLLTLAVGLTAFWVESSAARTFKNAMSTVQIGRIGIISSVHDVYVDKGVTSNPILRGDMAYSDATYGFVREFGLVDAGGQVQAGPLESLRRHRWKINVDGQWMPGPRPLLTIIVRRQMFNVVTELHLHSNGRTPDERVLRVLVEIAENMNAEFLISP